MQHKGLFQAGVIAAITWAAVHGAMLAIGVGVLHQVDQPAPEIVTTTEYVYVNVPGETVYVEGWVPCFEDEVVAWDGDAHTVCVNIDELDAYYHERFGS